MSDDDKKSNHSGTLRDVKSVKKLVNATDLRELACIVVDTISTNTLREVHADVFFYTISHHPKISFIKDVLLRGQGLS